MAASPPPPQLPSSLPGTMTQEADGSLEAKGDPPVAKGEKWAFIEPQPIREEQVQNAVKFLSHPKVKGSPIVHRRSFLERKGLSREEVDEAFRRVPDSNSSEPTTNVASPEGQYTVPPPLQTQSGVYRQEIPIAQQQPAAQQVIGGIPSTVVQGRAQPHWSQIVIGVGLLTAAGAGTGVLFQRILIPRLKAWIRSVVSESANQEKQGKLSPVEEAAAAATDAANAAAMAAAEMAKTNREMLKSRTEEWQHLSSILKSLEKQTEDLRSTFASMAIVSQDLPKQVVSNANGHLEEPAGADFHKVPLKSYRRTMPPVELSQAREGIQTSLKPQGMGQVQVSNTLTNNEMSNGHVGTSQGTLLTARSSGSEVRSQGTTVMVTQAKGASFTDYISQNDIHKEQPWWRRTKVEAENFTLPEQLAESTVQITEIDAIADGDADGVGYSKSYSRVASGHIGSTSSGFNTLGRQSWVPPPVPQTVMPGAASAIRYQKILANDDSKSAPVIEEKESRDYQSGLIVEASTTESEMPLSAPESVPLDGPEMIFSEGPKSSYADVVKE